MKASQKMIALLIAAVLLIINAPAALALPPLPSSFYGTVKANGANVPLGTQVTAWINGVLYATATVNLYAGEMWYSLDVPGDDPATPGIIEGGVQGNTIVFRMGTQTIATQTGTWQTGINTNLNLSANPTAVNVQGLSARTSGGVGDHIGSLLAVAALGLGGVAMIWLARRR